jgi:hypothetical protein
MLCKCFGTLLPAFPAESLHGSSVRPSLSIQVSDRLANQVLYRKNSLNPSRLMPSCCCVHTNLYLQIGKIPFNTTAHRSPSSPTSSHLPSPHIHIFHIRSDKETQSLLVSLFLREKHHKQTGRIDTMFSLQTHGAKPLRSAQIKQTHTLHTRG